MIRTILFLHPDISVNPQADQERNAAGDGHPFFSASCQIESDKENDQSHDPQQASCKSQLSHFFFPPALYVSTCGVYHIPLDE